MSERWDEAPEDEASASLITLVMAAGCSRRFGPDDKRLVRLAGAQTLLAASLAAARALSVQRLLVLRRGESPGRLGLRLDAGLDAGLGDASGEGEARDGVVADAASCHWITTSASEGGLGDSLADAFRWLSASPDHRTLAAAAVWLGDMAWIGASTCRQLARQARRDTILRPVYQGQPGHPVIFGRDLWPALCSLSGDDGAREVLKANPNACRTLAVDDPGVVMDLDEPITRA